MTNEVPLPKSPETRKQGIQTSHIIGEVQDAQLDAGPLYHNERAKESLTVSSNATKG